MRIPLQLNCILGISAYDLYFKSRKSEKQGTAPDLGLYPNDEPRLSRAARFKKTFSRDDVKIHFVGAW